MKINSVVIGAGIGVKHVDALNSVSNTEVIAICEKDNIKRNYLKKKI